MATRSKKASNSSGPLISVIVPAYNTRGTIAETIDSILAQTYKHYEIIVVDDGSPDDVARFVAKTYGKKVQLIRQANAGLAGARNAGIHAASGKFVAFLDSDDVWLPVFLEEQVEQIDRHPDGDVFYTNCYFWEDGRRTSQWTDIHHQKSGAILTELIQRTVMIPVLTAIVRREPLLKAGLFDASLRQVEDYDLWLRMASGDSRFYGSPKPLALYRVNPAGLSRNTLLMAQTQLKVYQKLRQEADGKARKLLSTQITIFQMEVLHQKRRLAIHNRQRLIAAGLTLQMAPVRPGKILSYLATACILLVNPGLLEAKLAA